MLPLYAIFSPQGELTESFIATQPKTQKKKINGGNDKVFYMTEKKKREEEWDFCLPAVTSLSELLTLSLSLFCLFGFHFSLSFFKCFPSSTVGCKREIVHHIPHIL